MSTNLSFVERQWSQTWLSSDMVDRVVSKLDAAHNGRLLGFIKSKEQVEITKRVWAEKLGGLEAAQLARGMRLAEAMDGPPTPAQFRKLCSSLAPEHKAYESLPKPEADPEIAESAIVAMIRETQARTPGRRCIYSRGYGAAEYAAELAAALKAKLPLYVADMRAMKRNAWSELDEAKHRHEWVKLGGCLQIPNEKSSWRNALYARHHEPPQWVLNQTAQQCSDTDHWIKTGELPAWAQQREAAA
jgi:hypothetical protein